MRYYDNGCFFTVSYSRQDASDFAKQWSCSTVAGAGSFQFDKNTGDLVDVTRTAATHDGYDWLAFSQDCQTYGKGKQ